MPLYIALRALVVITSRRTMVGTGHGAEMYEVRRVIYKAHTNRKCARPAQARQLRLLLLTYAKGLIY